MGSGGTAPPFLTSGLDGGEWSASRSCRFTPEERGPCIHWTGGWMGLRTSPDAVEKGTISALAGNRSQVSQPVGRSYTDWAHLFGTMRLPNESRDSSVGIAMGYGLEGQGSIPDRRKILLFSIASRLALGTTQSSIQWVPGYFPRGKATEREADHSYPFHAKVKNWGAIPPFANTPS
jgi:hypothetical protein